MKLNKVLFAVVLYMLTSNSIIAQSVLDCKSEPIEVASLKFIELDSNIIRVRIKDAGGIKIGDRGELMRRHSVKGKRASWGWSNSVAEVTVHSINNQLFDLKIMGKDDANDGILLLLAKVFNQKLDTDFTLETFIYGRIEPKEYIEDTIRAYGCKCHGDKRGQWHYSNLDDTLLWTENYDFAGKLTGEIVRYSGSGDTLLTGSYKDGKKEGRWINYFENGDTNKIVHYAEGDLRGVMRVFYPNGQLQHERVYDGYWTDTYSSKEWHDNGNLKLDYNVRRGEKEGPYMEYFNSGQIKYRVEFDFNKKHETELIYFENGNLKSEILYSHDNRFGVCNEYYENGDAKKLSSYYFDEPVGDYISYYENGQVEEQGTYGDHFERGLKDGVWLEFYKDGTPKFKGKYKMGVPKGKWTFWSTEGIKRKEKN